MTKKYQKVSPEQRIALCKIIEKRNLTVRDAASELGINYENAKAIYQSYRKTGEPVKKKRTPTRAGTSGTSISVSKLSTRSLPAVLSVGAKIMPTVPEISRSSNFLHPVTTIKKQMNPRRKTPSVTFISTAGLLESLKEKHSSMSLALAANDDLMLDTPCDKKPDSIQMLK